MDAALRTLADAGLALDAAEQSLAAGEPTAAASHLDAAAGALDAARGQWRDLPSAGRAVVGPAGRELRERHDAILRRLPRRRALSDGTPEPDPEQDAPPDG